MTADEVKAVVLAYWRYTRQCPLVGVEGWCDLQNYGELADVLAVTKERMLIETEVKVTLSDLKSDIKKRKHELIYFITNLEKRILVINKTI